MLTKRNWSNSHDGWHHLNAGGDGKDDEPEPEEDVNLLVDDV